MNNPLLSIVIANCNYGHFLEGAIQSVLSQNMGNQIELIVCDAASTDNSVDVIKKYANGLPPNVGYSDWSNYSTQNSQTPPLITWWCSEKDKGQSDAFNKGFRHASGRFGCWLNADDLLLPGSLNAVVTYLRKHPQCEWLAGSSVFVNQELNVKWCSRCVHTWRNGFRRFPMYSINGPSSFFLIENLQRCGGFDLSLRYTMDTDLWRRFVNNGIMLHHIHNYIWCFRVHEESKTSHKFITGKGNESFRSEGVAMNLRYGITQRQNKIGSMLNRLLRLASGAYLRSYIDTCRYRGKSIKMIWGTK